MSVTVTSPRSCEVHMVSLCVMHSQDLQGTDSWMLLSMVAGPLVHVIVRV